MIVQEEIKEVIKGGLSGETAFRIETTSKAFHLLSDGLYSDKIRAIIRELSCNAWDSHVAAGKSDQPIVVHLPNTLEPWFSVRDHGVGLNDSQVKGLYSTYFASTKTTSNDFIGALGLGSKSPFSYTKSFTITAIFDGWKRTYSAFVNEDDIPTIALLTEEETPECNGVEIRVPVRPTDFHAFDIRARHVLTHFKPTPIIEGTADFKLVDQGYLTKGDGWQLRKAERGARAVMGNVVYPINPSAIQDLTSTEASVLRSNFDIDFKIGELEVAASRESLSYKKATQKAIKEAAQRIAAQFNTQISKEFEDCPTEWHARTKYYDYFKDHNMRYVVEKSLYEIKWRGIEITTYNFNIGQFHDKLKGKVTYYTYERSYSSSVRKDPIRENTNKEIWINARSDVKFVYNDLPNQTGVTRISNWIKENRISNEVYFVEAVEGEDLAYLEKALGVQFIPTSTLPKVTKPKPPVKVLVWNDSNSDKYSCWHEESIDVSNKKGFYVNMSGWTPLRGDEEVTDFIKTVVRSAKAVGVLKLDQNVKLVGLRRNVREVFNNDPNWVDFWEYITAEVKKHFANPSIYNMINEQANFKTFQEREMLFRLFHSSCWESNWYKQPQYEQHPLAKFVEMLVKTKKASTETIERNLELAKAFNITINKTTNTYDFNKVWTEFTTKYPMLHLVTKQHIYLNKEGLEILLHYMK